MNFKDYETQVQAIYRSRFPLLRKWCGNPEKLKAVEEYCSLAEELVARAYDADRCEGEAKFCNPATRSETKSEYERIAREARSWIEEHTQRVIELREELGA